jgi:hypothetical protein
MVVTKREYKSPRLKIYGSARDLLPSGASPQVREALQVLAEADRKALRIRVPA